MDGAFPRMSMAHHIGDRLLDNAIAGDLNRRWQQRKLFWCVEGEDDATRPILCELFLNGRNQPKIIEGWWPQGVDQAADVDNRLLRLRDSTLQNGFSFIRVLSQQHLR